MKRRDGNMLIILVAAIAVLAATYPFIYSFQFIGVKKDLVTRRNKGREADLMNFILSNLDCPKTKTAPCTADIALQTGAGLAFVPATQSQIGPFKITPHCDPGTNDITIEFSQANGSATTRTICE